MWVLVWGCLLARFGAHHGYDWCALSGGMHGSPPVDSRGSGLFHEFPSPALRVRSLVATFVRPPGVRALWWGPRVLRGELRACFAHCSCRFARRMMVGDPSTALSTMGRS